jgi:uncharacterized repeat protein (TIGR01451 family)
MKKITLVISLGLAALCLFASTAETKFSIGTAVSVTGAKSVSGATAPGSLVTYTIVLTNTGSVTQADNPGHEFTDVLPSEVTLLDESATGGIVTDDGSNTVNWDGSIPGDSGSVTITIHATVNSAPPGTVISNQGTIHFDADNNGTNESTALTDDPSVGGATDPTRFTVGSPSLISGSKSVSGSMSPGSTVNYLIVLSNSKSTDQFDNPGNEFTDVLPADLTLVSADASGGIATANTGSNTVTWNGSVPGNDSITISVTATIKAGTEGHTVSNQGSIAYDADGNGTNEASAVTNTASFVVCPANLLVTTSADSGAGSLRQAILNACSGGTISFDITPGHVTSPITLTGGELVIDKDLTILGSTTASLTISGNHNSRIFKVQSGNSLTISNLTIADGQASFGGGIYSVGNLTIVGSTFAGNKAVGGEGGAIDSEDGTLRVINSTISGNLADTDGGGLLNCGNSMGVLTNVTITNNRADADGNSTGDGGGIGQVSSTSLILNNTIVAGNFKGSSPGTSANDFFVRDPSLIDGSSSNNLIGVDTGLSTDITNGANGNQIGTAGSPVNPLLGTLGNNGGPTQTHSLLPGSPAINTGDSTLALDQNGVALTTDQRGAGFARVAQTNVDIGAFEVPAGTPDHLVFNVQPSNTAVNLAITPAVKVRIFDAANNPTTSTATVSLAIGTNPSGGTLNGTVSVAAINGTATYSNLSIDKLGVGYTLVASSTGLGAATSTPFNITSPASVSGTKTVGGAFTPGGLISYTVTLNNNSVSAQLNNPGNEFTDVLPSGLTLVSASASSGTAVATIGTNTVAWNGSIPGSGLVTITINATINSGTAGNTISNQGTISYDGDGNGTNESTSLTDDPGVAGSSNPTSFTVGATTTTVTSSLNPSGLGQSVTFTATVTSPTGTPTGSVLFKDNGASLGSATLNGSGVGQFTTSSLTAGTHAITAEYAGTANFGASNGTLPGGQVVNPPLFKFSQPSYSVNENGKVATITVTRFGYTAPAATVDYETPDDSAAVTILPCATAGGPALARCDFTTARGTLRFAAGETSKTFDVLISQDNYVEGNETLTLTLSNPTGSGAAFATPSDASAGLTIVDDDLSPSSVNPIDDSANFVRQHYHDFLNREPDLSGLNFWVNQIESCGADQTCRDLRRQNVSGAFFLSIEFQQTGFYVYRIYKAGFGDISPPTVPVPLRYRDFVRDTQEVQRGVIVGQGAWQTQLDANKQAYALTFVTRADFQSRYPAGMTAAAFVDALNANAGNVLSPTERADLISELTPNPADSALRADVLLKIAENALLKQQEMNRSFVLMQYFGYLRRNPDAAPEAGLNFNGFNFWLNKLNSFNGNFVNADMVKAFITSGEYRGRFGR